mmetsp:Transcript_51463/g.159474  ORF Transcript_51463/g.159474 Transcript_51463/m.159474 type:complete len:255 (+) Transcript_51463:534-1298(+)
MSSTTCEFISFGRVSRAACASKLCQRPQLSRTAKAPSCGFSCSCLRRCRLRHSSRPTPSASAAARSLASAAARASRAASASARRASCCCRHSSRVRASAPPRASCLPWDCVEAATSPVPRTLSARRRAPNPRSKCDSQSARGSQNLKSCFQTPCRTPSTSYASSESRSKSQVRCRRGGPQARSYRTATPTPRTVPASSKAARVWKHRSARSSQKTEATSSAGLRRARAARPRAARPGSGRQRSTRPRTHGGNRR